MCSAFSPNSSGCGRGEPGRLAFFFPCFNPRDDGGFDGFRAAFDCTMVSHNPIEPCGKADAHAAGKDRRFSGFLNFGIHVTLSFTSKLYTGQPMADAAPANPIGDFFGGLFGGLSSLASTQAGVGAVGAFTDQGAGVLAPYNFAGANYIAPIADTLTGSGTGSQNIGMGRINASGNPVDFEDFAKNYNTSEGGQYLMDTARAAQDNSAAARGGLLSGANLRAQTGIAEGIANQDLLSHYQAMESGQQQDFNQRQQSYTNLYGQEALGENAALGQAGVYAQGARGVGSLYGGLASQTAAAGNNFGSGLGSLFGSILGRFFK